MNLGGKIPGNLMEYKKNPITIQFSAVFFPKQGFCPSKSVVIPIKSGTEGVEVGLVWVWEGL